MHFKVAPTTTFNNQGEEVNAIVKEKDDCPDLEDLHGYMGNLFGALVDLGYICLKEMKEQGSMGETCKYQSRAWGHPLGDCDKFNKEIKSLIDWGIIWWGKLEEVEWCMASNKQLMLDELNAQGLSIWKVSTINFFTSCINWLTFTLTP